MGFYMDLRGEPTTKVRSESYKYYHTFNSSASLKSDSRYSAKSISLPLPLNNVMVMLQYHNSRRVKLMLFQRGYTLTRTMLELNKYKCYIRKTTATLRMDC